MIVVDSELAKAETDGKPIRIALIGSGFMARGVAASVLNAVGMRLSVVYSRDLQRAQSAYGESAAPLIARSSGQLDDLIAAGQAAITDDPDVACDAARIDVVVEGSGDVEFGARVALRAIDAGKHVVLMNAQLNATLGCILKARADRRGVVLTDIDGDEPGVAMNLVRLTRMAGYRPVAAGNIKGMIDRYRTPDMQQAFAEQHRQKAKPVTSFADGTKLSMETAVLANAAGFGVARRGMIGPACSHVSELLDILPLEDALAGGGIVDYCVGAAPHTGAWVIVHNDAPLHRLYMKYFKMGNGPFYLFYTPFHLPHLQILGTIGRAVLHHDATVAPLGGPFCEVLTLAKRDLERGETLDGIGGYLSYGCIDTAGALSREKLLPMGLSEGGTLVKDIPKDSAIRCADVRLPHGRVSDALRAEQDALFASDVRRGLSD